MKTIFRLASVQVLLILMVGCSGMPFSGESVSAPKPFNSAAVEATDIKNLVNPESNKFVGGQPTEDQLKMLADAGMQNIVNLRTADEMDMDERKIVESLGMSYYSLPIDGQPDITADNAKSLRKILNEVGDESVLMHDGSGGRVGALMAIDHSLQNGSDIEEAVVMGKYWGLSGRIEPAVRTALVD